MNALLPIETLAAMFEIGDDGSLLRHHDPQRETFATAREYEAARRLAGKPVGRNGAVTVAGTIYGAHRIARALRRGSNDEKAVTLATPVGTQGAVRRGEAAESVICAPGTKEAALKPPHVVGNGSPEKRTREFPYTQKEEKRAAMPRAKAKLTSGTRSREPAIASIASNCPAKGGRPSAYRSSMCAEAVAIMSTGVTKAGLAGRLNISRQTLYEWTKIHPEFGEALAIGTARCVLWWEERLLKIALSGGASGATTACIFALKNIAPNEWRDSATMRHVGDREDPVLVSRFDPKPGIPTGVPAALEGLRKLVLSGLTMTKTAEEFDAKASEIAAELEGTGEAGDDLAETARVAARLNRDI